MDAYLRNISVEAIGPKEAEQYLILATRQEFDTDRIDTYAEAMLYGKWDYPGGTIELNVEGKLKDGHHRLMSVIDAGVVLPMIIVRNLPI